MCYSNMNKYMLRIILYKFINSFLKCKHFITIFSINLSNMNKYRFICKQINIFAEKKNQNGKKRQWANIESILSSLDVHNAQQIGPISWMIAFCSKVKEGGGGSNVWSSSSSRMMVATFCAENMWLGPGHFFWMTTGIPNT